MSTEQVALVPVDRLHPAPDNPRHDVGDVTELAASIAGQGLVQPLVVTPNADGYMIVAGERRYEAAKVAGVDQVLAIIREYENDAQRIEAMLAENLQRTDLTPLEEAESYKLLVDLGKSQDEIAAQVGKSQSHISKRVALVDLPEPAKKILHSGGISIDDALELRKLNDHPERIDAAIKDAKNTWQSMKHAIERQLREQRKADTREKAKERAKSEGIKLVACPSSYSRGKARILGKDGYSEVPLTKAQHKAEPCHAMAISSGYNGDKIVYVCTDVGRHNKKGASKVKFASDVRVDSMGSPSTKASKKSSAEAEERKARDDAWDAATTKREAFITSLVAELRGKKISKDDISTLIMNALVYGDEDGMAPSDAGKALGLKGGYGLGALEKFAAESPSNLQRAAFATALFAGESVAATTYRYPDPLQHTWYVDFIGRHGYVFTDLELEQFGIEQ